VLLELVTVLVFMGVGAAFVLGALVAGAFFRPKAPNANKASVYECGQRPIGRAWFNFNPRFYLIAITFLLFEVEIALAYPVAVVFKKWVEKGLGVAALVELLLFLGILVVGLAFVWGKGNLEWIRNLDLPDDAAPISAPTESDSTASKGVVRS
jgi:NADH-quinone oxidoreductase subunit A